MSEEDRKILLEWEKHMRVANRIVCEELGYPSSEALFQSIKEWEDVHYIKWSHFLCEEVQLQMDELFDL